MTVKVDARRHSIALLDPVELVAAREIARFRAVAPSEPPALPPPSVVNDGPSVALPAPIAQRLTALKGGEPPIAVVAGKAITPAAVEAAADTPERQRRLVATVHAYAAKVGLAKAEREDFEDFYQRVCDELLAEGSLAELETALRDVIEHSRLQAAVVLVERAVRASLPENAKDEAIEEAMVAALAAPGLAALQLLLPKRSVTEQRRIFGLLLDKYQEAFAGRQLFVISDELRKGGLARALAQLLDRGGGTPTVAAIEAFGRQAPEHRAIADKLLAPVARLDRLAVGETEIAFTVGPHGVSATASKVITDPILDAVGKGTLAFGVLERANEAQLILLAPESPQPLPEALTDEKKQNAALERVRRAVHELGEELEAAWRAGRPTLDELRRRHGLTPYLSLADAHRLVAPKLEVLVAREIASGGDPTGRAHKLQLGPVGDAAVRVFADKVRALLAFEPLSPALSALVVGKRERVGLTGTLDGEARAALHGLQRLAATSGAISDPITFGTVDKATTAYLADLDAPKPLALDPLTAQIALASAAKRLAPRSMFVADLALGHPAYLAHKQAGGTIDPKRFLTLYLVAQGFAVPTPPAALAAVLAASARMPIDTRAQKRAEAEASLAPRPSETELAEYLSAKLLVLDAVGGHRFTSAGEASAAERRALLARIAVRAQPAHVRVVKRARLGFLPKDEPVVALKLAIAKLAGLPSPVRGDGSIDGWLTGTELRALRDRLMPRGAGVTPGLYEQMTRTAARIDDGQLVLASLAGPAPRGTLAADLEPVLVALRQAAEAVRSSTQASDRAEAAVSVSLDGTRALADQPRPFATALAGLAKVAAGPARLGVEHLAALDALALRARGEGKVDGVFTARMAGALRAEFLARYAAAAASLAGVRRALAEQRLTIVEGVVTTTPPDAALAADARVVVALVLDAGAAEQKHKQAESESLRGDLGRAALSAAYHVGMLPGFGDDALPSIAEDAWAIAARRDALKGVGRGDALADVKGAASVSVDAAVLRFLVERHASAIGQSIADTILAGVPAKLPGAAAAIAQLRRVITAMEKNGRPWPSLHVRLDDDEDTRAAKGIVQLALSRIYGSGAADRDRAALKDGAKHALGLHSLTEHARLKAALIRAGDLDARSDPFDPSYSSRDVGAAAARAAAFAKVLALPKEDLAQLHLDAALLLRAAERGASVRFDDKSAPEAAALRRLATIKPPREMALLPILDFADDLVGRDALIIRSPLENVVPATAPSFGAASDVVGKAAPENEQLRARFQSWRAGLELDPERAAQTAMASALLFGYLMHTLFSYDQTVGPGVEIAGGYLDLFRARTPDERREAEARIAKGLKRGLQTWVMITDFISPVGFAQDLAHEAAEGHLDVLLGKALVYAPMMYKMYGGPTRALWRTSKQLVMEGSGTMYSRWRERRVIRGKPFVVLGSGAVSAEPVAVEVAQRGAYRRGVAAAYSRLASLAEVALDPTGAAGRALGRVRAYASSLSPVRFQLDRSLKPVLNASTRAFLMDDLERGGHGRVTIEIARKPGGPARTLTVPVRDLLRYGRGEAIDGEAKRRLGIDGREEKELMKVLERSVADMRTLAVVVDAHASAGAPRLEELVRNAKESYPWRVREPGKAPREVLVRNAVLLKLLRLYTAGDDAELARRCKAMGLAEADADAILSHYRHHSLSAIKGADRAALVMDFSERARLASADQAAAIHEALDRLYRVKARVPVPEAPIAVPTLGGALDRAKLRTGERLYAWSDEKTGVRVRVILGKDGKVRVRSGGHDVTEAALGEEVTKKLEVMKKRYGTLDAKVAGTLAALEAHYDAWAKEVQGQALTPERKKAFEAFKDEVDRTMKRVGVQAETVRERLSTLRLEARLRARSVALAFQGAGIKGASVELVRGSGRTLAGTLTSPSFYLVIVLGSRRFFLELGATLHDGSLSAIDKVKRMGVSALVTGGELAAVTSLFRLAGRLAPRLMAKANPLMWMSTLTSLPDFVSEVSDALGGRQEALPAMRLWRELGIPEAGMLRLDEKVEVTNGPYDDISALRTGKYAVGSRADYWYYSEKSPLHARLRQLFGEDVASTDSPVRRPKDLRLDRGIRFKEPVWPAVRVLESRPGFDMALWRKRVRVAAETVLVKLVTPDGAFIGYTADGSALKAMLTSQDIYPKTLTQAQKASLDARLVRELDAVEKWTMLLGSLSVSTAEKEAAVLQLIENLCALHRVNSLEYEQRKPQGDDVADLYTAAR
ncbi:MAG: hypothetical protein IT381_01345 [Deltaproteobacteria bacterium]|nr:hypothetical protein [Deltaproteobacteria bacterium]